jgi:hypothetical protein
MAGQSLRWPSVVTVLLLLLPVSLTIMFMRRTRDDVKMNHIK